MKNKLKRLLEDVLRKALSSLVGGVGKIDDGCHTFKELYEFRKMYNACLFNEWARMGKYDVHKSERHYEGEVCFGGGWFIVVAVLPSGQVSNHYNMSDWELFDCPELPRAKYEYDGHTADDVLNRLKKVALVEKVKRVRAERLGIPLNNILTGTP